MWRRTTTALSILTLALTSLAVPERAHAGGGFSDDDGNVHEKAIEAIADEGITKGCNPPDNNRYCPHHAVTRGQMAAFLRRALKLPSVGRDVFTDDDESIYESDIDVLAASGVTRGCNPPANDRFCPDATITRGEMAAFLTRAFDYPTPKGDFFGDDSSSVFEGDINALAAKGVTAGCNPPTNDRFCPEGVVERDQMASFLHRALDIDRHPPRDEEETPTWKLALQGRRFVVGGTKTNQGAPAEGLLLNARLVQAVADFSDRLPRWDAEANTDAFIAALDTYVAHGLNAITINFQGGLADRRWAEDYNNSAWTPNGKLKADYASRMTRALDAMTARGIVPIVGLFYFRQDQILRNEAALTAAVDNAIEFLEPWRDQIIVEVVNEANHGLVSHPILEPDRVGELVSPLRQAGYHATYSQVANTLPSPAQGRHNSVILLHGNDKTVEDIRDMVARARNRFPDRPVMFNEDGPTGRSYSNREFVHHLDTAIIDLSVGWGYYDQDGFQSAKAPHIDWTLGTPRKQLIFDRFAAHANTDG